MNYKVEAISQLAQEIKAVGFRVFIAKSGTYGFYTDEAGSRVVSFQYDLGGFKFSGNYKAIAAEDGRYVGTGWYLEQGTFKGMFGQHAPNWATGMIAVKLTTLAQHLAAYQAWSNYTEI